MNRLLVISLIITASLKIAISLTGSYCIVLEEILKQTTYNFTKLSNSSQDYVLLNYYSGETIRMQLCSPLRKKCNGMDDYNVCLINNGKEIGIGKGPPKVIQDSGRLMFQFTGDNCTSETIYKVFIVMECDYSATNNSHPQIIGRGKACNVNITWPTALACPRRFQHNCTAVDRFGYHYDLSALTKLSSNYVIYMGNYSSTKIILNVCHSVIFGYRATCEEDSGVCLEVENVSGRQSNIGGVSRNGISPFFENDTLKITYSEGGMCMENIPMGHIQTTISFICDPEAIDTKPDYVGGSKECHYKLIWKTAAACNLESLRNYSLANTGACTVTNPITNFSYNLQSLMNKDYSASSPYGMEYKFRICEPYIDKICKPGTGVCFTKNGTSAGMANTNLMWRQGGPYLNYTNGEFCVNGQHRYTLIIFLCGAEKSSSAPLIIEDEPCHLIIHWNTNLVCEKTIKCTTNDDEIDLTPLIRSTNDYVVRTIGMEFYINVCRPLISMQNLTCSHGSAICQIVRDSTGQFINETSLGFPNERPQLDENRNAILRYQSDSPCSQKPNNSISSKIIFLCDYNNNMEEPKYIDFANCTHTFEWKTGIVCGAVIGKWIPPCTIQIQNPPESRELNLSQLYDKQIHHVKNKQGKEYSVSICGGENHCGGSVICQGSNGYGSSANVIFDYSRNVIKLKYSQGSKCNNSSYTSELWLICNVSAGIGEPKLLLDWECSATFEWHTNVTCAHHADLIPLNKTDNFKEMTESTHVGAKVGIILVVGIIVAALFYLRSPARRAHLYSCMNALFSRRNSGLVQYSRKNYESKFEHEYGSQDAIITC